MGFHNRFDDPGMFKKLREVCRKHFHLVAPPKTSVVTSYDQKQCFCFVFCFVFVGFGGPGGGFGAPGGGFSIGKSSATRYCYRY